MEIELFQEGGQIKTQAFDIFPNPDPLYFSLVPTFNMSAKGIALLNLFNEQFTWTD